MPTFTKNGVTRTAIKPGAIVQLKATGWRQVRDHTPEPVEVAGYQSLTVAELEAEIKARNDGRDADEHIAPASKRKGDLIDALEADDATDPEDESDSESSSSS